MSDPSVTTTRPAPPQPLPFQAKDDLILNVPPDDKIVRMTETEYGALIGRTAITHLEEIGEIPTETDIVKVVRNTETGEVTYISHRMGLNTFHFAFNGTHHSFTKALTLEGELGLDLAFADHWRWVTLVKGKYDRLAKQERIEGRTEIDYAFDRSWDIGINGSYLHYPTEGYDHSVQVLGGPRYTAPIFPGRLGNLDRKNEFYISQYFGYDYTDPWFVYSPGLEPGVTVGHLAISSSRIKYQQDFGFGRIKAVAQFTQDLMRDPQLHTYNSEALFFLEGALKLTQVKGFKLEAIIADALTWAKKRSEPEAPSWINETQFGLKMSYMF